MQPSSVSFHSLAGRSPAFWFFLGFLVLLVGIAGLAALYMEHNGHWVTGMSNQIVWGLPHVCAVFLIIAASGALNVASIGSVFGKVDYQPLGRLSCLLAIALLAGGLAVLVLDLGRSDRLEVAATHLNLTSIFALNIVLYSVFFTLGLLYLWVQMDKKMEPYYKPVAISAFLWRLVLTTGTGSIFGLLVSRTAYHSALMAPMFIAFSLSFGLAVFILAAEGLHFMTGLPEIPPALLRRIRVLLAVLVAVSLYMVAIHHVTNLYSAERRGLERFLLVDGGIYTQLLWLGFVVIGSVLPLALLFVTHNSESRRPLALAALLVTLGGLALMYVIIVGGEAFPLETFPGKKVSSSFFDGVIHNYAPSLPEFFLGLGGFSLAGLILMLGLWVLPLLPGSASKTEISGAN